MLHCAIEKDYNIHLGPYHIGLFNRVLLCAIVCWCLGKRGRNAEDADTSVTFMAQVSSLSWGVQTGWTSPAAAIYNLLELYFSKYVRVLLA